MPARAWKRILSSSVRLELNKLDISTPHSIKVALGIGNCALGSYRFAVTQAKHCIVFVCPNAQCPIANDQLPKHITSIELGI